MKQDLIRLRGRKCEKCGGETMSLEQLQLHHKTYERLGRELISDLQLLCADCVILSPMRSAPPLGSGWLCIEKIWRGLVGNTVGEEFDEWLERRDDDDDW
jgi:hypothetical protein